MQVNPTESWRVAQTMSTYGFRQSQLGKFQQADSLLIAGFEQLQTTRGLTDKYTQQARNKLIDHYKEWNKSDRLNEYQN